MRGRKIGKSPVKKTTTQRLKLKDRLDIKFEEAPGLSSNEASHDQLLVDLGELLVNGVLLPVRHVLVQVPLVVEVAFGCPFPDVTVAVEFLEEVGDASLVVGQFGSQRPAFAFPVGASVGI